MTEPALAYGAPQADHAPPACDPPHLDGVGAFDASACLGLLTQAFEETTLAPATAHPSKAQWMRRAGFVVACAVCAVLLGGVAGTLSTL